MKKRVAYIIMTVMLLLLTIGQTVIPAFAGSAKQRVSDTSQLSSTVDYSKALSNSSSLSEVVANSQTPSQSSATISSTQQSSKASVSQSTTSQPAAEKKTKAVASQSIMLQSKTEKATDADPFPDFTNNLVGQGRVTAVNPETTTEEISAQDSAYPTFIPGVSTIDTSHIAMDAYGYINGTALDGTENNYITYGRVMNYTDAKGNAHSIDIREEFIKLEKRGWYLGQKTYLPPSNWRFQTGAVKDASTGGLMSAALPILSVASTYSPDMFMPEYNNLNVNPIPNSWRITNHTPNNDEYQFNQPLTVKLQFIDHDTQQPIKISGFLTLSDMDHRDYIDFDDSSNVKKVYLTEQSQLKGTMAGTGATIVNNLGNWDYTSKSIADQTTGETGTTDYPSAGMTIAKYLNPYINSNVTPNKWVASLSELNSNESISTNDPNAWATVVYENTDSLTYKLNDSQRLAFSPTSLVPVEFSAPIKTGDEATYSSAWDDSNVEYDMTTMLPYRGSTFKNPSNISSTITTFKPATEFVLSDPVDQTLTVKTVKVIDDTNKDVTGSFDIDKTDGKVVATAQDVFLKTEANYAKAYTIKITTTVAANADLSGYEQVDAANGNTYAKIPNTGHLTVIKKAGEAEQVFDSNEAYGYVKVPPVPQQKAIIKQEIKNDANDSAWQAAETEGEVGDKIDYRFTVKSNAANTDKLTKAKIQSLSDNSSDLTLVPGSLKVQIDSATATAGDESQFNKSSSVDIGDMDADTQATVTYQMTVTNNVTVDKDIINEGSLFGTNLDNLIDKTHVLPANKTTLHLKRQTASVDVLTQTVENITAKTAAENQETEGGQDDQIQYAFTAHVKAETGSALKGLTLKTQENDATAKYTDADGVLNDDTKKYDTEYKIVRADGTDEGWQTVGSGDITVAAGSIQIKLPADQVALSNDDTVTVRYSKSIKTTPAENKYLYNDGSIGDAKANYTRIKPLTNTKITVRYVDLDEDLNTPDTKPTQVADEIQVTGKIGSKLSEGTPTITGRVAPKIVSDYTVLWVTEDADLTSATWQAAYKDDPQFETTDRVITYGYKKAMLTIDAPKTWDFGTYNPTQTDSTYYLSTKKGKTKSQVAVVDYYGVQSWHLKVQQNDQFKDAENHELTGAELRVTNGDVSTSKLNTAPGDIDSKSQFSLTAGANSPTEIMSFDRTGTYQSQNNDTSSVTSPYTDAGQGIWYYNFGTGKASEYSVGLHVPATTKRYKTHYTTELTWSVTVAP